MVKLLVLSDLHLEYCDFVPDKDALAAADVVVLAGDMHDGIDGIAWARKTFGGKPIVYVAGNHEFHGGKWVETLDEMRHSAKVNDVYLLENDTVTIDGIRFLGCTLWTDFEFHGTEHKSYLMEYCQERWLDYQVISDKFSEVAITAEMTLERHQASRAWLEAELPKGDPSTTAVVTHHFPHARSVDLKYLNDAFTAVCGSCLPEQLLLQAGLWIHGHIHSSRDYRIDGEVNGVNRYVRVACNPRGYSHGFTRGEMENPNFNPGLLFSSLPDGNWAESYEI